MKKLILLLVALLPALTYAQESEWTELELEVLHKFDLRKNDIRGVIFTTDDYGCDVEAKSENEALLAFLVPDIRKDLTRICVETFDENYTDQILDIHQVIKLYILKTEVK